METLHFSQKISVNVPVGDLWRFLYDTDRLNRSMGLPTVSFVPDPDATKKGHYAAETRLGPLPLRYEEFPFEWVENRYYRVLRRFKGGPFAQIVVGVQMAPDSPERSTLELVADVVPRFAVAAWLARLLMRKMAISGVIAQVRAFEDGYRKTGDVRRELPAPAISESQFTARLALLDASAIERSLVPRLVDFIRHRTDTQVAHIRPFELSDEWKAPRTQVLQLFLQATRAGILDLTWEVVCPHCRASPGGVDNLAGITASAACATCEKSFQSDFSATVEAVFSVNPAIRNAKRGAFCIGGPANMPRIIGQFRLEPSERRRETLATDDGLLVARCYQSDGLRQLRAEKGRGDSRFEVDCRPDGLVVTAAEVRANAPIEVELKNELAKEALVVIEKDNWRDTAATAAIVATIQEFRDLFPEQAVAPGQEIRVGRLAVLFTDLQGSTALYSEIGDVRAFDFVHGHFQFLMRCISRNNGGLIKTIGDAVMAAFPTGRDAVKAAVDMQTGWDDFLHSQKLPAYVGLRVGVHEGSALAFNNRGLLDYFGTTVNMAARIQGQSSEREVILSSTMAGDTDVADVLGSAKLSSEPFSADLKGISGAQSLVRIRFSPS